MADLRVPDLNKVLVCGRLTRDPELKYTNAGKPFCRGAIANTRYYKGQDGERKEDTCFVDFTCWGPMGEFVGERLKKGRPVMIEGSLRSFDVEDRESGQKRKRLELNAQRVTPLDWEDNRGGGGSGGGGYSGGASGGGSGAGQRPAPAPRAIEEPIPDDDIPF